MNEPFVIQIYILSARGLFYGLFQLILHKSAATTELGYVARYLHSNMQQPLLKKMKNSNLNYNCRRTL